MKPLKDLHYDSKRGRRNTLWPDINLTKLAEEAGISPSYLSQILNGHRRTISLNVAMSLARALGMTVEQLNQRLKLR